MLIINSFLQKENTFPPKPAQQLKHTAESDQETGAKECRECEVTAKSSACDFQSFQDFVRKSKYGPFDHRTHGGHWRQLTVRTTQGGGGILAIVEFVVNNTSEVMMAVIVTMLTVVVMMLIVVMVMVIHVVVVMVLLILVKMIEMMWMLLYTLLLLLTIIYIHIKL